MGNATTCDPSCRKLGGYYMYSTISKLFVKPKGSRRRKGVPFQGHIQMHHSKDLNTHWGVSRLRHFRRFPEELYSGLDTCRWKRANMSGPLISSLQRMTASLLFHYVRFFGRKTSYIGLYRSIPRRSLNTNTGKYPSKQRFYRHECHRPLMSSFDEIHGKWWMHATGSFFGWTPAWN